MAAKDKERIQKKLAQAGFGSRRSIEVLIRAGRIKVNQRVAKLGDCVSNKDKITIDDKPCKLSSEPFHARILLYHKPTGEVCTRRQEFRHFSKTVTGVSRGKSHTKYVISDQEKRRTVFESLPPIRDGRWISIGRLDINTAGLILFTNDGELAHRLMHPSSLVQREYAVRVMGTVSPEMIKRLVHGVLLEDGKARFEDIVEVGGEGANHWFHVVVAEGRNRLVRRLWESQGVKVSRLIRVRFGPIFLPKSLRKGAWLELGPEELKKLQNISVSLS